jgi:ABC-2 type transport system permease protein
VENAIGPIIGSIGIIIVMLIIGNLPFEFFESIKPYLVTTYLNVWEQAFQSPIDGGEIIRQSAILGIFFLSFTSIAWIVFRRKDILS